MSDWQFPQDDGRTPLSEEDRQGLLLSHIATRDDLNDAEQRNITKALRRSAPSVGRLLDDLYLRELHRAMLGEVWEWAGKYRRRVTNIGAAPADIATDLRILTGDAEEWVKRGHFEPDELAVRFHHLCGSTIGWSPYTPSPTATADTAVSAPTISLRHSDARRSLGATTSTWKLTPSDART